MARSSRTPHLIILIALSIPAFCIAGPLPKGMVAGRERLIEYTGRDNIHTGILYDLVLPLSSIERYAGREGSPPISLPEWKQIYHELYNASISAPAIPPLSGLIFAEKARGDGSTVPIGIIDMEYERLRPEVKRSIGEPTFPRPSGSPCVRASVFAAAPLRGRTFRGGDVTFVTGSAWYFGAGREGPLPSYVEFDPDDGNGYRRARFGERIKARYLSEGSKSCSLRAIMPDGSTASASFRFEVAALATPDPHDTLLISSSIPYEGGYASGEAYVYCADSLSGIRNPVVVIEGFDIGNEMFWDELYTLLNQEGLVERVRAEGFDVIVLNFLDSTDYIQRNSFVVVELLQQLQSTIPSSRDMALIGASMGGLCGRYALAYMENGGIDHRVRTFVSFDAPHRGANIPLGVQYWVKFFSGQSEAAAGMLTGLESPSARQMLEYHFTDPPGGTGESDPLRGVMLAEFASLGSHPSHPRKVAVANGSGHASGQSFSPGEQIVLYEYQSILVDIVGNVWAVPDDSYSIIFDGLLDLFWPLPDDAMTVYAAGTRPLDNAPGGTRGSMADMDSTEAAYGDIIALHQRHCFIPTVSALDLDTEDLFYDIAADPSIMDITPFDTIYWAPVNEEHVFISPACADLLIEELMIGITGSGDTPPARRVVLRQNRPNPFNPATSIDFGVPFAARVSLRVYDVSGRLVRTLIDGNVPAGWHNASWDGRNGSGRPVASGIYFYTLTAADRRLTRKMILLR